MDAEDIRRLDELDERFRNQDLQEDVENLSSIHDFGDGDSFFSSSSSSHNNDEEEDQLRDRERATEKKTHETLPESRYSSDQIIHLHQFQDIETPREESEYDLVKRLTIELHEKRSENSSQQLQINHLQLQVQALLSAQEQVEQEKDELSLQLTIGKQNLLLLEARLKEVAQLEHVSNRISIDALRGKLLETANNKYSELLNELHVLKTSSAMKAEEDAQTILTYSTVIEAVKKELYNVCEQLSSRAVLYQALHRRHQEMLSSHQHSLSSRDKDYYILQGELQATRQKHDQLEAQLSELTLKHHALQRDYDTLEAETEALQEMNQNLNEDLNEARSLNLSQQTMLDQFRSGNMDVEQIQIQNHQQITALRQTMTQQERVYQEEIAKLRDLVHRDSEARDELSEWNHRLRQELQQKNELLHTIQHQQQHQSQQQYYPHQTTHEVIHHTPVQPLQTPVQTPHEEKRDDEEEEEEGVEWLLTPNQLQPLKEEEEKINNDTSVVAVWLTLLPRVLRLSLQWTDLFPVKTKEEGQVLVERLTQLSERLLEKETDVTSPSLDEHATLLYQELANLCIMNYDITDKLLSETYESEVKRLKEKASQFRQKCAKLQQFAIKLLEKAGEKKLIHMSDIPNDLSTSMMSALSLSPNTSLSLPFPSSPPPPLTSPGQSKPFQSSEEMERVREIENSLTLYKQDIDRLESQISFYKEENDALYQQIAAGNMRQREIEALEERLRLTEEATQVTRTQHTLAIQQLQQRHQEEMMQLEAEVTSEAERKIEEVQVTLLHSKEVEKEVLREDYRRYLSNLTSTIKQYEGRLASALHRLDRLSREKSHAIQQSLLYGGECDRLTSLLAELREEVKEVQDQLREQGVRHRGVEDERERLLRDFEEVQRRCAAQREEIAALTHHLASDVREMSSEETQTEVRDVTAEGGVASDLPVMSDPSLSVEAVMTWQRYTSQLCATIESLQHSRLLAIQQISQLQEKLRQTEQRYNDVRAQHESQERVFEQMSEEKRIVLTRLHSFETLLSQQEEQIRQQKMEYSQQTQRLQAQYQDKLQQLQRQYDVSLQQVEETKDKELLKWQKKHTSERRDIEQQLADVEADKEVLLMKIKLLEEEVERGREAADVTPLRHEMSTEITAEEASWFLSPDKPTTTTSDDGEEEEEVKKEEARLTSAEIQTDPILLDQLLLSHTSQTPSLTSQTIADRMTSASPVLTRRSLTPSHFLSPPTLSVQQSSEFEKLLAIIQEEENNLHSVRGELKDIIAEKNSLQRQNEVLQENNSLLANQLLKCNDKILSLQAEYSRARELHTSSVEREEVLLREVQKREEVVKKLQEEKERMIKESEEMTSELLRLRAQLTSLQTTIAQQRNHLQMITTSQHQSNERQLDPPNIPIPAPSSLPPPPPPPPPLPPTTATSHVVVMSEEQTVNVSRHQLKELLHKQKTKLLEKFQKKYDKQQRLYESEKQSILHMLREECREIVAETNRLLLAKRDLALQQSQVNEIIQELSQRTIFLTPSRVLRKEKQHHHHPSSSSTSHRPPPMNNSNIAISPITATSHPSNHHLDSHSLPHNGSSLNLQPTASVRPPSHHPQHPPFAPFPLTSSEPPPPHQSTDNPSKSKHHRRSHSDGGNTLPRHNRSKEEEEKRKHFMNSSLLRESLNSFLSATSSLPPSVTSSLNLSSTENNNHPPPLPPPQSAVVETSSASNSQEHLLRLYPEMIPPKVTKKLINQIFNHQSHSQIIDSNHNSNNSNSNMI